jgi:hypothetical protein
MTGHEHHKVLRAANLRQMRAMEAYGPLLAGLHSLQPLQSTIEVCVANRPICCCSSVSSMGSPRLQ